MNVFQRWKQTTVANKALVISSGLMAFGTIFYAGAAIVQVYIMKQSARNSSLQTEQLIKASDRNADAAESFSKSADAINTQTEKAVGEFHKLAKATEISINAARKSAKDALDASVAQSTLDRRPWVGLQLLQCNNCRIDTDGSLVIGDLSAVLVNTGKTPAIDMVVSYTFIATKASDPIPTYDAIEKDARVMQQRGETIPPNLPPDIAASIAKTIAFVNQRFKPPKEVLAPNAPRGITIIAGLRQTRNRLARLEDQNVIYGLGKITYYDGSRILTIPLCSA